jgi:hypothetical protein
VFSALASASAAGAQQMLAFDDVDYHIVQVAELVVPDLRVEFGSDTSPALVLSAPVHVYLNKHIQNSTPKKFWLTAFVEPQLRTRGVEGRALLGTRLTLPLNGGGWPSMIAELASLAGTDGAGFTGGLGFAGVISGKYGFSYLGVVYRYVITTESQRHDVSLDLLTVPF